MNAPQSQREVLARITASTARPGRLRKVVRWALIVAALLGLAVAGLLFLRAGSQSNGVRYETAQVERGNLTVTVTATGKLQPTNQVDVGSELSGTIQKVFVDDNDTVTKGQLLAQLDLSKLNAQVEKSKATLASARARVQQTEATLTEARANLQRLQQVAALSGGRVPSKAELETAKATVERAIADRSSALAAVNEAQATLETDQTNIRKASIRAPIDGLVLARRVEPGQTVAASFQAPVLFTLAEDLRHMELEVDVDEADVGQVRKGQEATFTVDAYPNRVYTAQVILVRYGSDTVNNVVSYKTRLVVDNTDLSLRPGMTATAEIVTAKRDDALLVPNAALRFTPPAPKTAAENDGGFLSLLYPRWSRISARTSTPPTPRGGTQTIWVLKDGQLAPVTVTLGATDGRMTEIVSGDLKAGMAVVTDAVTPKR
jgi:HlyD family secretion protein